MTSPILGKCVICGSLVADDSKNNRPAVNPESFHKGVLCGKASCGRAQSRKLKKDGQASFRASLMAMTAVQKARTLKETASQEKKTEKYLKKEKEKAELFKRFSAALETGSKAAFKGYFSELENLLKSINDTQYRGKTVDYFIDKIHKRLCSHHKITNDFNGSAEQDPYKILYNELERKIISLIDPGNTGNPRITPSHPCHSWIY